MDRATKQQRIAEISELLGQVASLVLTGFEGIDVDGMRTLRRALREKGAGYKVVKNTLMARAIAGTPMEPLQDHLKGPIGVAYSTEENPGGAAKACLDFAKKVPKLLLKVGYVDGQLVAGDDLKRIADLPSQDELRATFVGLLVALPQQFLSLLQAVPRDIVGVIDARRRQLEEQGAS